MGFFDRVKDYFNIGNNKAPRNEPFDENTVSVVQTQNDENFVEFSANNGGVNNGIHVQVQKDGTVLLSKYLGENDEYDYVKEIKGLTCEFDSKYDNNLRSYVNTAQLRPMDNVNTLEVMTYVLAKEPDFAFRPEDKLYRKDETIKIEDWQKNVENLVQSYKDITFEDVQALPLGEKRVTNEQIDKLYEDLNFDFTNIDNCNKLREVLSEKHRENESKAALGLRHVYEEDYPDIEFGSRWIDDGTVYNLFSDKFCKDAIFVDFEDSDLRISKTLLNNIKNPDLTNMIYDAFDNIRNYDERLEWLFLSNSRSKELRNAMGESTFEIRFIDYDTTNDRVQGSVDFKYIFPYNFKKDAVEQSIKNSIHIFIRSYGDGDNEMMNESLTDAVFFANFCEKYAEKWLNEKAEKILVDELNLQKKDKLVSLDKRINHNELSRIDNQALIDKVNQLNALEDKLYLSVKDNQNSLIDEFRSYCENQNDKFPSYLKLELPEQKTMIVEYNKLANEVNREYKDIIHEKKNEKEERFNNIGKAYGIHKKNEQQFNLER